MTDTTSVACNCLFAQVAGSTLFPSPVKTSDYLSIDEAVPVDSISTSSAPLFSSGAPENSWKSYSLIEGEILASSQSEQIPRPHLSPETELELIEVFFQSIQPHYQLFQRTTFLDRHNSGQVPNSLLSAVLAVSIANSTNNEIAQLGFANVSDTYAFYAWQACLDIVVYGLPATLDDLKTLFLLGLYEFRNAPNRKAWNVTGHLVRQAFDYGLHQVETTQGCCLLSRRTGGSREKEELRHLWWSIYILDTCCNLTNATPSNIDLDMVNTYLPSDSAERWSIDFSEPLANGPLCLKGDIQGLSELVIRLSRTWLKKDTSPRDTDSRCQTNFLFRVIITSILRELSNVRQIAWHSSGLRAQQRWKTQSSLLAAFQLGLPEGYLDPQRNFSSGESAIEHTLRLVTVIEINVANIWLKLPKSYDEVGSKVWLTDWCASLATADRIVEIVKHWETGFTYLADPAISYIIFTSMVLIQTHNKLDRQKIGMGVTEPRSPESWHLLRLFLQRLGNHWLLPKALLTAADNFRLATSSPLSLNDAAALVKNFQRPLTFRKPAAQNDKQHPTTTEDTIFDISGAGEFSLNPNILPHWLDFGNVGSFPQ